MRQCELGEERACHQLVRKRLRMFEISEDLRIFESFLKLLDADLATVLYVCVSLDSSFELYYCH